MYEHRLRPQADRIILAKLHGTAIRHAVWRQPTEDETAAAVADLREISASPELLAETAGLMYGFARSGPYQPQWFSAASYCIAAGADPEWVQYWAIIGHERAAKAKRAPRQDWEPAAAPAVPLTAVQAEFAGLPLRPYSLTHRARGLTWTVTAVTGHQTQRTGRGEEVAEWRYEVLLTGPLPHAPQQTGEFAAVMEWAGDGWGMRPAAAGVPSSPPAR